MQKPAPQRFNATPAALLQHQRPQTNRQTYWVILLTRHFLTEGVD